MKPQRWGSKIGKAGRWDWESRAEVRSGKRGYEIGDMGK